MSIWSFGPLKGLGRSPTKLGNMRSMMKNMAKASAAVAALAGDLNKVPMQT